MALPKRKTPKKSKMVTFSLPDYDGDFTLPSMKSVKQKEGKRMARDQDAGFAEWLERTMGAEAAEVLTFLDEMEADESETFMNKWQEASGVDLGKSSAASS